MNEITRHPNSRFFSKIDVCPESQCWNWTGTINSEGYGKIRLNSQYGYAHRTMWEFAYGKIPDGLFVCHSCDNRACVNPIHLFVGDQKANLADMSAKGRSFRANGETNGRAVLTAHDVRNIRTFENDAPHADLAKRYGVSSATIQAIRKRKTWKHL